MALKTTSETLSRSVHSETGASKFMSQINNFQTLAKTKMAAGARGAILEIVRRTLERSPVSPEDSGHSGRFKANWIITKDAPTNSYNPDLQDPDGENTFSLAFDALDEIDFEGDFNIWWSNHTPYAVRLEYGWSHAQAPAGMVRITVREWSSIVREAFIKGGGGADTGDSF